MSNEDTPTLANREVMMRPMFTVHGGEFLVGQHIEGSFKGKNVWVPTKNLGVDLLTRKRFLSR